MQQSGDHHGVYTYQNITLYNLKYLEMQQINKDVHTQS